jgi:1,2-diacylglycerol 3-alpha-glucosyltransferase
MKAKIGIITTWFERGAAHVSKAIMDVIDRDFEVHIYARGGEVEAGHPSAWGGENVHWGSTVPYAMKTHIDLKDFQKWLKETNPDVLLFNEQHSWEVVLWLKENTKIPIGAYIDYYTDESRPFFGLYDYLICNTRRHHMAFQDHPLVFYIPWGTDLSVFQVQEEAALDRAKPLRFFHNAGMNPYRKGCDLVLEAFSLMKEKNCELIIHAQLGLEDLDEKYQSWVLDSRVTWLKDEVPAPGLYHLGDVYVYPSRLDGIGLSLPEALACGLPAIVPNEGPMNEFVVDEENGKWVDVAKRWKRSDHYFWPMNEVKAEELAKVMDEFVLDNPNIPTWKFRTREHAEKHLDWKKNAAQLPSLLLQVQARKPKAALLKDAAQFQKSLEPVLTAKMKFHRLLVRLGARKVKHIFVK